VNLVTRRKAARLIELRGLGQRHMEVPSFNGRLRGECLNSRWFLPLADARAKIEVWRRTYNIVRPHSSLGYRPPLNRPCRPPAPLRSTYDRIWRQGLNPLTNQSVHSVGADQVWRAVYSITSGLTVFGVRQRQNGRPPNS